jgi:hypothetical protein
MSSAESMLAIGGIFSLPLAILSAMAAGSFSVIAPPICVPWPVGPWHRAQVRA